MKDDRGSRCNRRVSLVTYVSLPTHLLLAYTALDKQQNKQTNNETRAHICVCACVKTSVNNIYPNMVFHNSLYLFWLMPFKLFTPVLVR